jgi:hypothetical protein
MGNNTVLQDRYSPQIQPAFAGMIADMVEYSIQTRVNETVAGIGFGLAVGQGTRDKGCVLGGASFLGISVIDKTQVLSPIDPLSGNLDALDVYGMRKNVAVLSRGHVWVLAGSVIAANDGLFYNSTNGGFSNSASGQAAYGSVMLSQQPADGNTLVINGATLTFKAAAPLGTDGVLIGPTLGDTVLNAANVLNGSVTVGFSALKYSAFPASPGGAGQGSGANTIMIASKTVGTAGNAFALNAGTTSGVTLSGATLSGGTAAATAITGGRWLTTAIAGQLAKVSLALQN